MKTKFKLHNKNGIRKTVNMSLTVGELEGFAELVITDANGKYIGSINLDLSSTGLEMNYQDNKRESTSIILS